MILIKCSCGCFYTVKSKTVDSSWLVCQNCGKKVPVTTETNLKDYMTSQEFDGVTVSLIPDDASVSVSFNA